MDSSHHSTSNTKLSTSADSSKRRKTEVLVAPVSTGSSVENPILLALGATPRSRLEHNGFSQISNDQAWVSDHQDRTCGLKNQERRIESSTSETSEIQTENSKSTRNRKEIWDAIINSEAAANSHKKSPSFDESGEEPSLSIDPLERVEHRATKSLRREIVIASPAGIEDEEYDSYSPPKKSKSPTDIEEPLLHGFDCQPVDLILYVFSFMVESDDLYEMALVSKRWRELTDSIPLYRTLRNTNQDGSVNWYNFQNLGIKNKGTEGTCFKCRQRSTGKILAMKRARVFPKGEGVPYYMLRELAVLQGMRHPNIASLEMASLAKDELHVFFPYVDKTLHEIINPTNNPSGGIEILPEHLTRKFLHQLLDAIAYCHRRGVLHRNLKPKHLLIDCPNSLEHSNLLVSDFALVRATGLPRRVYTTEVVTLWYRPPEILMGVRGYTPAVDIWSIGCIFAEMIHGKPLFTGISEIDQLFQIFSKLSTPTTDEWPEFKHLPNYTFEFPNWKPRTLNRTFPKLSSTGVDLLSRLLTYNPQKRISAEDALRHPYFTTNSPMKSLMPSISMKDMHYCLDRKAITGVSEFVLLYHDYLRDSEMTIYREVNYLSRQKALRPIHRAMLVDWLIEVVDVFEMCPRTAFLAVNYTDRYLDKVVVKKNSFQLLGATCLHVASKCEDVSYIGVDDLAMCADNVYTSAEVLQTEEKLLNTLNFTLAVPTVLDFLSAFEELMPPMMSQSKAMAHYLAELALQEYDFLQYMPSLIATCCISLAMYYCEQISWDSNLEKATRYKWDDLKDCMLQLQKMYINVPQSVLNVVKKRYSKTERFQVSSLAIPHRFNMIW